MSFACPGKHSNHIDLLLQRLLELHTSQTYLEKGLAVIWEAYNMYKPEDMTCQYYPHMAKILGKGYNVFAGQIFYVSFDPASYW